MGFHSDDNSHPSVTSLPGQTVVKQAIQFCVAPASTLAGRRTLTGDCKKPDASRAQNKGERTFLAVMAIDNGISLMGSPCGMFSNGLTGGFARQSGLSDIAGIPEGLGGAMLTELA